MNIRLENIGKKFRNEWIFRNLNFQFKTGKKYGIIGPNGSGKSTLLQIISGLMPSNLGTITYSCEGEKIDLDDVYRYIYITAPYIELIEEYTLEEALDFHLKFKTLNEGISKADFLNLTYLEEHFDKPIKQFSSGMKQRFKLGLAFLFQSNAIFLDEPTTNLDERGIDWYLEMVKNLDSNRVVLISSNDKREFDFCDDFLSVSSFKN